MSLKLTNKKIHPLTICNSFCVSSEIGEDVSQINFDDSKLREHIQNCLILGKFSRFHTKKVTRNNILHEKVIEPATCCHRTITYDNLIQCGKCHEWKHLKCENITLISKKFYEFLDICPKK